MEIYFKYLLFTVLQFRNINFNFLKKSCWFFLDTVHIISKQLMFDLYMSEYQINRLFTRMLTLRHHPVSTPSDLFWKWLHKFCITIDQGLPQVKCRLRIKSWHLTWVLPKYIIVLNLQKLILRRCLKTFTISPIN